MYRNPARSLGTVRKPMRVLVIAILIVLVVPNLYMLGISSYSWLGKAPAIIGQGNLDVPIIGSLLPKSKPTVNLVIASIQSESVFWANFVPIENLKIVRYVADDPTAEYHPPLNKGHEAMMYHTYFYDFYDKLPDVSIFIHATETSWHVDSLLGGSMSFALANLNVDEVIRRGYANLRVSWDNACGGDWINTTVTSVRPGRTEEIYMYDAFVDNFSLAVDSSSEFEVPEILAQPCCSQFAVTRDTIRSVPREEYGRYVQWLAHTEHTDDISGRVWEHMFHYLFTKRAVDCPVEWKTYCQLYYICFESGDEYDFYVMKGKEVEDMQRTLQQIVEEGQFERVNTKHAVQRLNEMNAALDKLRQKAIQRGKKGGFNQTEMEDLYRT